MTSDPENADHPPAPVDHGSLDTARSGGTAVDTAAPALADPYLALIERAARDPSVSIEKLERMFELRDRLEAKRAKADFFAAFSDLQTDLPAAIRAGKGHNQKSYARFEDVMEALRPALRRNGFSISHRVDTTGDRITVTGVLAHRGGHSEETTFSAPPDASGNKAPIHAIASAISYGRRYTTTTLTGMATEDEDDDGKAAAAAAAGPTITDAQAEEIKAELEATGGELPRFCAYWKLDKLTDLPLAKLPAAMKSIHDAHKRRQEQTHG